MGIFDFIERGIGAAKELFGDGQDREPKPAGDAAATGGKAAAGAVGGATAGNAGAAKDGDKKPVGAEMAEASAASLSEALAGWGTDENAVADALRGKTKEEVEAIKAAYAAKHPGESLDTAIKESLDGGNLKEAEAMLAGDQVKAATEALKDATSGFGTDEARIMATLRGMSPAEQAAVRARFKQETGQSLDQTLEDTLSGEELEAAKAELAGKFSAGLGEEIDELARKSPTLTGRLSALQDEGWTISYGEEGKGTFASRAKKTIVIDPKKKDDPLSVVRSLAHEGGHAGYALEGHTDMKGLTKEEYVEKNTMRHLKDEGEATIMNLEVRKELLAAEAGDIGVSGRKGEEYKKLFEKYPDPKDRDKLREEIARVYAKGEVPSVKKKDGSAYADYEEYYAKGYIERWDKDAKPGADGKAPSPSAPHDDHDDHSDHGH